MKAITYSSDVDDFIKSLDLSTSAKVVRAVELLKLYGHLLSMPHSKKIAPGIFELRTRGQQEARIFYCFHKGNAILLHGFIKKSQKIPPGELKLAISRFQTLTII